MTSDAKIGLLLGLVFIFIIAFVINGLPRLRHEPESNQLTINSADKIVEPQTTSIALPVGTEKNEQLLQWTAPAASQQMASASRPAETPQQSAYDQQIRSITPLPKEPLIAKDVLIGLPVQPAAESIKPANPPVSTGPSLLDKLIGPASQPASKSVESTSEPAGDNSASSEAAKAPQPEPKPAATKPQRPKPASQTDAGWPKKYRVRDGDSLALIAKKFYGPEQGNRLANIQAIFEANKQTLKSPDQILVGQELLIPAPKPVKTATKPENVFPSSLVEKVTSIGSRHLRGNKKGDSGRFYVVKEGDRLWDIAERKLGAALRYKEIIKLNPQLQKDPDNLVPGMRLKLPER